MAVTIHVNGKTNSLVHKGSMGIAKSTIPDVCKTPSPGGPVPIPYPVIVSMSGDLKKGTKTVKVDGKKMAAVKGSEFSRCTGDEPGTAGGGVKSSTNMKEATWLLYSFDVKLDGKNACRLSDKMMMNHGNTACLGGEVQIPVFGKDIEGCDEAGEKAKEADSKGQNALRDPEQPYVVCGTKFLSATGDSAAHLMGGSMVGSRDIKPGNDFKDFAKGTSMKEGSNVPCPSNPTGKHQYASSRQLGHAEAKVIETLFKNASPGTPKGKLYLKVQGKPVCGECKKLIACAEQNEGFEVFICP